jgi:hypothetical protein
MNLNQTKSLSTMIPANPFDFIDTSNRNYRLGLTAGLLSAMEGSKKRALHEVYDDADTSSCSSARPLCRRRVLTAIQPSTEGQSNRKERDSKVKPSTDGLQTFGPNDVLSGRGGGTNQHEGNCYFRALINQNREKYLRAKKNDKPFISLSIVKAIRDRNGRFLKKVEKTGLWYEIGDAAAREKTSQALRQRAPEYRRQLFQEDLKFLQQPIPPTIRSPICPSSSDEVLRINSMPALSLDNNTPIISNSPINDANALLDVVSETIRRAQLKEAQEAVLLQQKIHTVKLIELALLKSSGSRRCPNF